MEYVQHLITLNRPKGTTKDIINSMGPEGYGYFWICIEMTAAEADYLDSDFVEGGHYPIIINIKQLEEWFGQPIKIVDSKLKALSLLGAIRYASVSLRGKRQVKSKSLWRTIEVLNFAKFAVRYANKRRKWAEININEINIKEHNINAEEKVLVQSPSLNQENPIQSPEQIQSQPPPSELSKPPYFDSQKYYQMRLKEAKILISEEHECYFNSEHIAALYLEAGIPEHEWKAITEFWQKINFNDMKQLNLTIKEILTIVNEAELLLESLNLALDYSEFAQLFSTAVAINKKKPIDNPTKYILGMLKNKLKEQQSDNEHEKNKYNKISPQAAKIIDKLTTGVKVVK